LRKYEKSTVSLELAQFLSARQAYYRKNSGSSLRSPNPDEKPASKSPLEGAFHSKR